MMMDSTEPNHKIMNEDFSNPQEDFNSKSYSLSGKIMLSAIIILFFVVILMLSLHLYARWCLLRTRRRYLRRNRHHRRTQLVFYADNHDAAAVASRGLDASVIISLPVFAYSSKTHPETVECAVCLSEFGEGETGRVLPKCNHTFHSECIDMWFYSHSTCPLCRAPVEPTPVDETRPDVVITLGEPEPGSSSGFCAECRHGGEEENRTGQEIASSSIGFRRKPSWLVGVTIEVPPRNLGDESSCDSPSNQSSFRSPMSRMLSFKRILSRERKGSVSPSTGGCSSTTELYAERGGRDETR